MMPEILTESFCERCGTRYTFESVAPRKTRKLGQFKTLSKGVKNWVMSDDSSLDEAMAAARGDEEREATAQQLDAFHSTFNFCMNCRQYTCSNCWNPAEGRCLTCAPNLGAEILPAPFPNAAGFDQVRLDAGAWPEADLGTAAAAGASANGTPDLDTLLGANGVHHDELNGSAAGSNGALHDEIQEIDPAARLAFLSGEAPTAPAWPTDGDGASAEVFDGSADLIGLPDAEPPRAVEDLDLAEAAAAAAIAGTAAADDADPTDAAPATPAIAAEPLPEDVEGRAAAMTSRTSDLLGRFRPGQNIDAELAAYEAGLAAQEAGDGVSAAEVVAAAAVVGGVAAATEDESVEAAPAADAVEAEDHHLAAAAGLAAAAAAAAGSSLDALAGHDTSDDHAGHAHESADEAETQRAAAEAAAIAAAAAAEAAAAEPEPVVASAAPEPTPEPDTPAAAAHQAAAAEPVREDVVEQPTWRIFAPDPQSPSAPPVVPPTPAPPGVAAQASAEPQWPSRPDLEDSPSMALLANRARASSDAMWAASAREVVAPASAGAASAAAGIQSCSSCGLSLSANARFCRRCGTRQG